MAWPGGVRMDGAGIRRRLRKRIGDTFRGLGVPSAAVEKEAHDKASLPTPPSDSPSPVTLRIRGVSWMAPIPVPDMRPAVRSVHRRPHVIGQR
jgi:hypothetical protein